MERATEGWRGSGKVGKGLGWLERPVSVEESQGVFRWAGGLKRVRKCWRGPGSVIEFERTRQGWRGSGWGEEERNSERGGEARES